MSQKQFERYIEFLKKKQQKHPKIFKLNTGLLIIWGFVYMFLMLALEIGLMLFIVLASAVAGPLGVVLVFFLATVLLQTVIGIVRLFAFRAAPPEGVQVTKKNAPELYKIIKDLERQMNSAKVHKILLTTDLNASVMQVPRFGILGGYKNYLSIGTPLLVMLDPTQCKAVIAHELGHISRSHGKFTLWVCRMAETWEKTIDKMVGTTTLGEMFFLYFYKWFITRLRTRSLVLWQVHESDADKDAANNISPQALGDGLSLLGLHEIDLMQGFWNDYYCTSVEMEVPASLHALYRKAAAARSKDACEIFHKALLSIKTDCTHRHPSLKDRLAFIGAEEHCPKIPTENAADAWIPAELLETVERFWRDAIAAAWQLERTDRLLYAARLKELSEKSLTTAEQDEKILCTQKVHGTKAACTLAEEILKEDSLNPAANFVLGLQRSILGDFGSIDLLMRAVNKKPAYFKAVSERTSWLHTYFRTPEDFEKFQRQYRPVFEKYGPHHNYITYLSPGTAYTLHMDDSVKHEIQNILEATGRIKKAFLMKKKEQGEYEHMYILYIAQHKWGKKPQYGKEFAHLDHRLRLLASRRKIVILPIFDEGIASKRYLQRVKKTYAIRVK